MSKITRFIGKLILFKNAFVEKVNKRISSIAINFKNIFKKVFAKVKKCRAEQKEKKANQIKKKKIIEKILRADNKEITKQSIKELKDEVFKKRNELIDNIKKHLELQEEAQKSPKNLKAEKELLRIQTQDLIQDLRSNKGIIDEKILPYKSCQYLQQLVISQRNSLEDKKYFINLEETIRVLF